MGAFVGMCIVFPTHHVRNLHVRNLHVHNPSPPPHTQRAWKQEQVVRDFFSKPPRPSRGLPARPVPGSAVSVKLDVEQAVIDEWFGE